jgi:hypothetical protein
MMEALNKRPKIKHPPTENQSLTVCAAYRTL